MPKTFQKKFILLLVALSIALIFRLALVAETTGNWRGFFYTTIHIVLVAGAAYYLLRDASLDQATTLFKQRTLDSDDS